MLPLKTSHVLYAVIDTRGSRIIIYFLTVWYYIFEVFFTVVYYSVLCQIVFGCASNQLLYNERALHLMVGLTRFYLVLYFVFSLHKLEANTSDASVLYYNAQRSQRPPFVFLANGFGAIIDWFRTCSRKALGELTFKKKKLRIAQPTSTFEDYLQKNTLCLRECPCQKDCRSNSKIFNEDSLQIGVAVLSVSKQKTVRLVDSGDHPVNR